ncbi:hypothetical protein L3i22_062050 [Actinoplanes sp. L3-i22]|nr:hypothetical protein L3i22_062050 [Actinoplanes sp. L3-i22]
MYDYYLGGSHNFAADRDAAEQVIAVAPNVRQVARANRAFLHRAVRFMTQAGITQFLDIGSGIPTAGNVHDIAAETQPHARVVYADIDPIAVAHSVELLRDNPHAAAIRADLRYPDAILSHYGVRDLLDLTRPVGLLLVSMLHFLPDEQCYPAVATLRDTLAPGSLLAISHVATEATTRDAETQVAAIYQRTNAPTAVSRTLQQISAFFGDFHLEEPGVVWVDHWPHPTEQSAADPRDIPIYAGLGRKISA